MTTAQKQRAPALRFKDEDGKDYPRWEEKFVRDICEINPSTDGLPNQFTYIDLDSVYQGMLVKENKISKTSAPSRAQRILKENDVLFQTVRPYQQNNFFFNLTGNYVASTGYAQLRAKSSPLFLYYLLHEQKFVRTVLTRCTGTSYPAINSSDIGTIRIHLPDEKEQQKIAAFLSAADTKIEQLNRKKSLLEQYKKGMMQKLFSQELRFKDEDGRDYPDWEEKELGDVSEVLMCKRIFASQTNPNEGVPFYKIGTLGGEPDAFISKYLFEEYKSKYNFPRLGEILITCSGTVGKCLAYDGSEAYFQDSNIVWIDNPTLEVSNEFLLSILSNIHWSTLSSTTITRIYGSDLRGLVIKFPQNEQEQKRITDFLSALERKIELVVGQIEQARTFKQGLLQEMFI